MPERPTPPMLRRRFTSLDLYRLVDTFVRAGEDIMARPLRISTETMRRASRQVGQSLLGPWSAERLITGLAGDLADLVLGLSLATPGVLRRVAGRLATPPRTALSEYDVPISGAGPAELGLAIDMPDDPGRPFVPPARILDASQGWAIWFVPIEKAAALLQSAGEEGALMHFEPIDCGAGRAMICLLGTDYRVSDFGRYREIALAAVVTPRGRAVEPGSFIAHIVVSAGAMQQVPVGQLWGLHATPAPRLQVTYSDGTAGFHAAPGGTAGRAFHVSFPRFGGRRTFDEPRIIFSVRRAALRQGATEPLRSVLEQNGRGQGLQVGGNVALRLGDPSEAGCLCVRDGRCLCRDLRDLGIAGFLPAANGWTERLTGQLLPPGPPGLQPLGNQAR